VDCVVNEEDPPVTPTYTWVINKPDGTTLNGSGATATVLADKPGAYSCTFTATANRECPPDPITIGPETTTGVEIVKINVKNNTASIIGDGPNTPSKTDGAAVIKGSGDVLVEVELNPALGVPDLPESFITWSGGQAVPGNQLERKASKSSWVKHTLTATCSASNSTMLVYVIGAEPTNCTPANGISGSHFPDNSQGYPSTGVFGPDPLTGSAESRCEIEFSVVPDVLITDGNNGLFTKADIQWDVSREKRVKKWTKTAGVWSLVDDRDTWASDDSHDTEEDNNPWDGNGHLYGNDAPTNIPGSVEAYVKKMNMREWVRVGLGGITGRSGTVCSEYSYWHVFRSLKKNGTWANDNTYDNEIAPGNVFWGSTPIP